MSDLDPLANLQPDDQGNGGAPTPPDPTPPAPEPPAAPVDGTGDDGKLTDEEKAEADEWDKAADELFPGLKKTQEDKKDDEPTKPKEDAEAKGQGESNKNDKDSQAGKDGKGEQDGKDKRGSDEEDGSEDEPAAPDDAVSRLTAREQQAEIAAVKADISDKMKLPVEWKDQDGDPIKSVNDVMKLLNRETGKPFTREEAEQVYSQAQEQIRTNMAQIDAIADTNLMLKDEADIVNYEYGELLRAMPEIRDQIWKQYERTLAKDKESGIITKAPVSLKEFYTTALEPYAQLGRRLEAEESAKQTQTPQTGVDKTPAPDKAVADRQQRRQDRSDIYGGGKMDTRTDEQKDWDAAAEAVFGDQLKALK